VQLPIISAPSAADGDAIWRNGVITSQSQSHI